MIDKIDARSTVLSVARSLTWIREEGGDNRGPAIKAILAKTGLSEDHAWCAAFATGVLHSVLGSLSPIPLDARCARVGEIANGLGMLSATPSWGALFLLWGESVNRYRHTGFLVMPSNGIAAKTWKTVEGNARSPVPGELDGVFERERSFAPLDRFVCWWL